jgi:hypothetical protein
MQPRSVFLTELTTDQLGEVIGGSRLLRLLLAPDSPAFKLYRAAANALPLERRAASGHFEYHVNGRTMAPIRSAIERLSSER